MVDYQNGNNNFTINQELCEITPGTEIKKVKNKKGSLKGIYIETANE